MSEKMNPEIKKQWVTALRSGDYKQGKTALCTSEGHCCLGVLSDLHAKAMGIPGPVDSGPLNSTRYCYLNEVSYLPQEVCQWAGLSDRSPTVPLDDDELMRLGLGSGPTNPPLAELNDHHCTFKEIADFIETQL